MSNFKLEKLSPVDEVLRSQSDTTTVATSYMNARPYMLSRVYDGSENNLAHPSYGKSNTALLRKSAVAYGDGISTLSPRTPTPREISNAVCKSTGSKLNSNNLTDFVWLWGQFVDHELDLTPTLSTEPANMTTPGNDLYPGRTIPFDRSNFKYNSSPRQQVNVLSSYIDCSNVYSSDTTRCYALRKLDGSGELKTTTANNGELILPYNTFGLDNAQPTGTQKDSFFIAGDIRANENVALTAVHTLFVREHNRLAQSIKASHPLYTEEEIFQAARRLVTAFMQKITYTDFLPLLIGDLSLYTGYKTNVDSSVVTEFSTVGFRLGHTMVSSTLSTGTGSISLITSFFNPSYVQTNGIDNLLLGASNKLMQEIDNEIVDELRDFLFGAPTALQLLDLASLNIQRARDHGITDYNSLRVAYGLTAYTQFSQITTNTTVRTKLQSVYSSINGIDPWVGALCEDHQQGAAVGPLLKTILKDQFERLRDGDRYWWQSDLMITPEQRIEITNTKLSDIINRNCSVVVSSNVFKK